jgi:hypothetical protein
VNHVIGLRGLLGSDIAGNAKEVGRSVLGKLLGIPIACPDLRPQHAFDVIAGSKQSLRRRKHIKERLFPERRRIVAERYENLQRKLDWLRTHNRSSE